MPRAVLAVLVASSGCAYRFVLPDATLPGGATEVDVAMLQNRTAEANVEAWLTESLAAHYARVGLLRRGAPAVIGGVVTGVSTGPLVASTTGRPQPTYRLALSAELTVTVPRGPPRRVTVSEVEDFPGEPDALTTEASRGAALRRLVEVVARRGAELISAL